jgi:8-oxo-dGTP diphosphatase
VDIVLLRPGLDGNEEILLIRRGHPPYAGHWALPGGFVDQDEPLEAAARRELKEETHLDGCHLRQVGAFGDPDRDPRGRVISIAYLAQADRTALSAKAEDDAADAAWWSLEALPQLAFDHAAIIQAALVARARG